MVTVKYEESLSRCQQPYAHKLFVLKEIKRKPKDIRDFTSVKTQKFNLGAK